MAVGLVSEALVEGNNCFDLNSPTQACHSLIVRRVIAAV